MGYLSLRVSHLFRGHLQPETSREAIISSIIDPSRRLRSGSTACVTLPNVTRVSTTSQRPQRRTHLGQRRLPKSAHAHGTWTMEKRTPAASDFLGIWTIDMFLISDQVQT